MCVSVLLVLGDKIRAEIDKSVQEQWLMSYIGKTSPLDGLNRPGSFTSIYLYTA